MKNYKIENYVEFCCPTLIFSYFFLHNIFLVLIGILLSIYLINIANIQILLRSIYIKYDKKIKTNNSKNNIESLVSNRTKKELMNEKSKLSLAEIIEEVGFIPSSEKNENKNAA